MTKEEFITKAKELAVDFWTMNLHKGTYESHLRDLLDDYETKQCNIANVVGQSEQLVCKHCGKAETEHTEASNMCPDRFKYFEAN